jgi:hypothetical protein
VPCDGGPSRSRRCAGVYSDNSPKHSLECLRLAAECLQLAAEAKPDLRSHFVQMAKAWTILAEGEPGVLPAEPSDGA